MSHYLAFVRPLLILSKSFEPTGWAVFRGALATYSVIGFGVFSIVSAAGEIQLYVNGDYTVQDTIVPAYFSIPDYFFYPAYLPYATVTIVSFRHFRMLLLHLIHC